VSSVCNYSLVADKAVAKFYDWGPIDFSLLFSISFPHFSVSFLPFIQIQSEGLGSAEMYFLTTTTITTTTTSDTITTTTTCTTTTTVTTAATTTAYSFEHFFIDLYVAQMTFFEQS